MPDLGITGKILTLISEYYTSRHLITSNPNKKKSINLRWVSNPALLKQEKMKSSTEVSANFLKTALFLLFYNSQIITCQRISQKARRVCPHSIEFQIEKTTLVEGGVIQKHPTILKTLYHTAEDLYNESGHDLQFHQKREKTTRIQV